jgi:hypothetical protein
MPPPNFRGKGRLYGDALAVGADRPFWQRVRPVVRQKVEKDWDVAAAYERWLRMVGAMYGADAADNATEREDLLALRMAMAEWRNPPRQPDTKFVADYFFGD